MLVDLTHGAAAVCAKLGIPRAPGLAELADGRVSFDEIVHVDDETPLQVIPAGQAAAKQDDEARAPRPHLRGDGAGLPLYGAARRP